MYKHLKDIASASKSRTIDSELRVGREWATKLDQNNLFDSM